MLRPPYPSAKSLALPIQGGLVAESVCLFVCLFVCVGKGKELLNLPGVETRLLIKYKRKYTNLLVSLQDQVTNECVYGSRGIDPGTCWHYRGVRRHIHAVPRYCYRNSLRVGPHIVLYRQFCVGNWTITALKPNIHVYSYWQAPAEQLQAAETSCVPAIPGTR
jgi:hypothetical protein